MSRESSQHKLERRLGAMGESIRELRRQLGMSEAFPSHERFLHYRNLRGPNVPGEPKLAEALLKELTRRESGQ